MRYLFEIFEVLLRFFEMVHLYSPDLRLLCLRGACCVSVHLLCLRGACCVGARLLCLRGACCVGVRLGRTRTRGSGLCFTSKTYRAAAASVERCAIPASWPPLLYE